MTDKKRREWSVYINADEEISLDRYHGCDDELIKVRECFPGDIVISRDELRAALSKGSYCNDGSVDWEVVERELFGKAET